jgi:hypothetical protein
MEFSIQQAHSFCDGNANELVNSRVGGVGAPPTRNRQHELHSPNTQTVNMKESL